MVETKNSFIVLIAKVYFVWMVRIIKYDLALCYLGMNGNLLRDCFVCSCDKLSLILIEKYLHLGSGYLNVVHISLEVWTSKVLYLTTLYFLIHSFKTEIFIYLYFDAFFSFNFHESIQLCKISFIFSSLLISII